MKPRHAACLLVAAALAAAAYLYVRPPERAEHRVQYQRLEQTVVASGRVVASTRSAVGTEITGVVAQRRVQEGDRVAAGDLLVALRADEQAARVREARSALDHLEQSRRPIAAAAVQRAEAHLAQMERETRRREVLLQQNAVSRESVEQARQALVTARAEARSRRLELRALEQDAPEHAMLRERLAVAQADLARTEIRADADGIVLTRNVDPGDLVRPGDVLLELARTGPTEILVPLDEQNLSVLAVGQRATVIADAYPDRPFEAALTLIAPKVDPRRGTVDVRLLVEPAPDFLRQDMTVSVTVHTGSRERALAVPHDALARGPDGAYYVRVARGRGEERVRVELGLRGLAASEVVSGLSEGDAVILDQPEAAPAGAMPLPLQ